MIEVASNIKSILGEGPVWDKKNNSICWIDIRQGHIHILDLGNHTSRTISVGKLIGAIALDENGNFIAAKENGVSIIDRNGNTQRSGKLPDHSIPHFRFNDGKCDAQGRFWVGGMSDKETVGDGCLYCINKNWKFDEKIRNLTIPNGMAWSRNDDIFYFIDTPSRKVLSYSFDLKSGVITNPKVVFTISEKEGYPDGMTIDEEGMLWIAHFGGGQVTRWNPARRKKLLSIKLPVSQVTSCVFGGDQLEDLYITTAYKGLSNIQLGQEPLAGSLFVWKNSGYKGLPPNLYKN